MTAPPWGHKPPPVDDPTRYWAVPPPEHSERLLYWMRRLLTGTWHPNRYIRRECAEGRAHVLGVYVWEATHVLAPMIRAEMLLREGR